MLIRRARNGARAMTSADCAREAREYAEDILEGHNDAWVDTALTELRERAVSCRHVGCAAAVAALCVVDDDGWPAMGAADACLRVAAMIERGLDGDA